MSDHPPLPTRLTVAALVHWQGRFLLVEEEIAGQRRFNQPAGHVEPGEDLIQAACRELKEETGLTAAPTGWLGVYLFKPADSEATFVRTAVIFDLEKSPGQHHPEDPDGDVLACHWLSLEEIAECKPALRSPLVWQAPACRCRHSRPSSKRHWTLFLTLWGRDKKNDFPPPGFQGERRQGDVTGGAKLW